MNINLTPDGARALLAWLDEYEVVEHGDPMREGRAAIYPLLREAAAREAGEATCNPTLQVRGEGTVTLRLDRPDAESAWEYLMRGDDSLPREVVALVGQLQYALSPRGVEVAGSVVRNPDGTLAREQPCGCVVCYCATEDRCMGCGAKMCGTERCVVKPTLPAARDASAADSGHGVSDAPPPINPGRYTPGSDEMQARVVRTGLPDPATLDACVCIGPTPRPECSVHGLVGSEQPDPAPLDVEAELRFSPSTNWGWRGSPEKSLSGLLRRYRRALRELQRERERAARHAAELSRCYGYLPLVPGHTLAWDGNNLLPHVIAVADEWAIRERQMAAERARAEQAEATLAFKRGELEQLREIAGEMLTEQDAAIARAEQAERMVEQEREHRNEAVRQRDAANRACGEQAEDYLRFRRELIDDRDAARRAAEDLAVRVLTWREVDHDHTIKDDILSRFDPGARARIQARAEQTDNPREINP